jgi:hypothetical protein
VIPNTEYPAGRSDEFSRQNVGIPTRACRRCYLDIDSRALVCGHCQFTVAQYEENLARRSISSMRKVQIAPSGYRFKRYKALVGDRAGKSLIYAIFGALVGAVLLLIPVIGWIVGGAMLLGAMVHLLTAFGAPLFSLFSTFGPTEQAAKRSREDNTYTDVDCPACRVTMASGKRRTILFWPDDKDSTASCKACKAISYRFGDQLLWVPHPKVFVGVNLKEFLLTETGVGPALGSPSSFVHGTSDVSFLTSSVASDRSDSGRKMKSAVKFVLGVAVVVILVIVGASFFAKNAPESQQIPPVPTLTQPVPTQTQPVPTQTQPVTSPATAGPVATEPSAEPAPDATSQEPAVPSSSDATPEIQSSPAPIERRPPPETVAPQTKPE